MTDILKESFEREWAKESFLYRFFRNKIICRRWFAEGMVKGMQYARNTD